MKLSDNNPSISLFLSDKRFRLYNRLRSRLKFLNKQYYLHDKINSLDASKDAAYDWDVKVLTDIINRLDTNYLNCNSADGYAEGVEASRHLPRTNKLHAKSIFGFQRKFVYKKGMTAEIIAGVMERAKIKALHARVGVLKHRLISELQLRDTEGWYFVFNTLTVDPVKYKEVFSDKSSVWTDYIRSVDRAVGITKYGSWAKARQARKSGGEFHSYFCVVEHGSTTGRLHLHVLHACAVLPKGCVDPNAGAFQPRNREIDYFRRFWRFGFSTPKAVRTSVNDAYGKLCWKWPVELKDGVYSPIQCKPPAAVARYVTKYIIKAYFEKKSEGGFKWRCRISKGLGTHIVTKWLNQLSNPELRVIMKMEQTRVFLMNDKVIPMVLIKSLSGKLYLSRSWKQNELGQKRKRSKFDKRALRKNGVLWVFLRTLKARPSLILQLRAMIRGELAHNLRKCGSLLTETTKGTAVFEIKEKLKQVLTDTFLDGRIFYQHCGVN